MLSACYRNSTLGFLAHVFHVGDVRIYRVNVKHLEQLTKDHRLWFDEYKGYLNRALGIDSYLRNRLPEHYTTKRRCIRFSDCWPL